MADVFRSGTKVAPREAAGGLFGDFDRLFDTLSRGFFVTPFDRGTFRGDGEAVSLVNVPRMDVAENDREFRIAAELPGMDEKDVAVSVTDGVLTIRGHKEAERKEEKENYHLTEREYGSFERSLRLPPGVAEDKISASFEKGVLTVLMPKSAEARAKARQIPIGRK